MTTNPTQPLEAVMIGAGHRGYESYAPYALSHPNQLRFVAVAEPDPMRRQRFAEEYGVPQDRCFVSWEELADQAQLAPAAINCTMDGLHASSTLALLDKGYHVLLEKPMAIRPGDCVALTLAAQRRGRILQICHVLRHTAFFSRIHELVATGKLGRIITIEHRENVAYWHMAHSYVRGNWRNQQVGSPMILAKCCHDMDILYWNLGLSRRLASFGSLTHFRQENAPPGAPRRCTDGCPAQTSCPYFAPRLYLTDDIGWPTSVISTDHSLEARRRALETGPYGRCVYFCDNDVVDHQIVSMEFESGVSASLFMHGHSQQECRTLRYDGTEATLRAKFSNLGGDIELFHRDGRQEKWEVKTGAGHGGGDLGLMASFVKALREPQAQVLASARESLESHLMSFAAEKARIEGVVISMSDFRKNLLGPEVVDSLFAKP